MSVLTVSTYGNWPSLIRLARQSNLINITSAQVTLHRNHEEPNVDVLLLHPWKSCVQLHNSCLQHQTCRLIPQLFTIPKFRIQLHPTIHEGWVMKNLLLYHWETNSGFWVLAWDFTFAICDCYWTIHKTSIQGLTAIDIQERCGGNMVPMDGIQQLVTKWQNADISEWLASSAT